MIELGKRYGEFDVDQLKCPIHNCFFVGAGGYREVECPNTKCSLKLCFNNYLKINYLWYKGKEFYIEDRSFHELRKGEWVKIFDCNEINMVTIEMLGENLEKYLLL